MPDLAVDGVRFHVSEQGAGAPLVLLHGFTGSGESWWPVVEHLARDWRVVAIDLIGHGHSDAPRDPARYAYERALDDLDALAAAIGISQATWLGYSLGGRLALGLALRHPRRVAALILESVNPGITTVAEREDRRRSDAALAARIEADGIASFVAEWQRLPLWDSQRDLPVAARERQRTIRLGNRPHALANSLRGMGQGSQPDHWADLAAIRVPTLVIAGERDGKFARIGQEMAAVIPDATLAIVPGAGHAVHLERPEVYFDLIRRFARHGERPLPRTHEEYRK
ncbi:MAG: 2-succinyl-6-hydroxy-2,4-cyclohexadiene-1-carboxylate synthase [Thermomicrobiales bacterium]